VATKEDKFNLLDEAKKEGLHFLQNFSKSDFESIEKKFTQ
jgi:hypothetical protein